MDATVISIDKNNIARFSNAKIKHRIGNSNLLIRTTKINNLNKKSNSNEIFATFRYNGKEKRGKKHEQCYNTMAFR